MLLISKHNQSIVIYCIYINLAGAGPQCSCSQDLSTSNVSCKIIFADSYIHPIYPIVTWRINGAYLATYTLQRTKIDDYVFLSQSTITIDTASSDIYECEMSFAEPIDIQYPSFAANAPEFSESCSTEGNQSINKSFNQENSS